MSPASGRKKWFLKGLNLKGILRWTPSIKLRSRTLVDPKESTWYLERAGVNEPKLMYAFPSFMLKGRKGIRTKTK